MIVCSSISSASKYVLGDGDNFYCEFIRDYILVCYVTMSLEVYPNVHMYLLTWSFLRGIALSTKAVVLGCFRLSYPKMG